MGRGNSNPNTKFKQTSDSLRYSFRLSGRSTSITLRKNIVSLWLVLSDCVHSDNYSMLISDFVDKCLDDWENDTAKGLSDFITDRMIHNILENDDFRAYRVVLNKLSQE